MSKRLQILLPDEEMEELRRLARREKITVSEWVRRALQEARAKQSTRDAQVKLNAIREATLAFPAADMDQMLAEIERGYGE